PIPTRRLPICDYPKDFGSEKTECCEQAIFTLEEFKWEEPFSSGLSSSANSGRRVSWAARNRNGTGRKHLSGPSWMSPRKEKMDLHSSRLSRRESHLPILCTKK